MWFLRRLAISAVSLFVLIRSTLVNKGVEKRADRETRYVLRDGVTVLNWK